MIVELPNIVRLLMTSLPLTVKVQFVNLSMSTIGAMGSSCNSHLSLLNDLRFDTSIQKGLIMKAMSFSIRSSYYIFCGRNKRWTNPELVTILFFHSFYLLL